MGGGDVFLHYVIFRLFRRQSGPQGIGAQVLGVHVGQLVTTQITHRQFPEQIVQHRGRHLDDVVAFDDAVGLEPGKCERVHIVFQGYAVL